MCFCSDTIWHVSGGNVPVDIERNMLMIIIIVIGGILIGLGLLALAALRWGVDSRDPMDSPEWERRQAWFGGQRKRAA